jgi:hypothetical protein
MESLDTLPSSYMFMAVGANPASIAARNCKKVELVSELPCTAWPASVEQATLKRP